MMAAVVTATVMATVMADREDSSSWPWRRSDCGNEIMRAGFVKHLGIFGV